MRQDNIGYMSGTAFSTNAFLGGILVLLVKLFMGVLVVAAVVGIAMWIKETFFKDTNINKKIVKPISDDPMIKTIVGITAAVLGGVIFLALLQNIFRPSMGYSMRTGTYSSLFSLAGILGLLIKALSLVLIVALILAAVNYFKKHYNQSLFNSKNEIDNEVNDEESNTNALVLVGEDNSQV